MKKTQATRAQHPQVRSPDRPAHPRNDTDARHPLDTSIRVVAQRQRISAIFGTGATRLNSASSPMPNAVVQRELFNHGHDTLLTTDLKVLGGEKSLEGILTTMISRGAVDDARSLKTALLADRQSGDDETAEWAEDNVDGILLLLQRIDEFIDGQNTDEAVEEAQSASSEPKITGKGMTIGKLFFPGDTYHQEVKPAVIAAIGKKKLSVLVYKKNDQHNFNFWFDTDGRIYAEQNSTRTSTGKDTGYRWDGSKVVKA